MAITPWAIVFSPGFFLYSLKGSDREDTGLKHVLREDITTDLTVALFNTIIPANSGEDVQPFYLLWKTKTFISCFGRVSLLDWHISA